MATEKNTNYLVIKMSSAKEKLLQFFERPLEPYFWKYKVPDEYLPEKYKSISSMLKNRAYPSPSARSSKTPTDNPVLAESRSESLTMRKFTNLDLTVPMKLPYNEPFSLFLPSHRKMAASLIDMFMSMDNCEDLQSLCAYCQMRINPYLFNYCLSVCIMNRKDTKGLKIPSLIETFPAKFVDPKVFRLARERMYITKKEKTKLMMPITIPTNFTASNLEPEQRVAYFREDIGINLHHWHWHLVYPFDCSKREIVDKDRRGELFYYMHQQIIARYNVARMCNGLRRVLKYDNVREPIAEGYFPKLNSQYVGKSRAARFANTMLRDLNRPSNQIKLDLTSMEYWRNRFVAAIENMSILLPDYTQQALDETTGIDTLGNMMEASIISPHKAFYGDLHNMGHIFIGYAHDPDHRYLEDFGVMGDSATAMRDPVFYRWHAYIDDLFQLYKNKLTPYAPDKLDFEGVSVSSISIEGTSGANNMSTLWEQSTVDLGRGLDFSPEVTLLARFTHLQHDEFKYAIEVKNSKDSLVMGLVRIFIAPVVDEDGKQMPFDEQRKHMIELDKFPQPLNTGSQTIRRSSHDSTVTIPYDKTFRFQGEGPENRETEEAADFNFCGCGWPQHMLIPKGNTEGYPMVLFVMISNFHDDWITQDLKDTCGDASSYCGIKDRKYPDRQAMGYPFDRPISANSLQDFLRPNMAMQSCNIHFSDRTRIRGQK